MLYLEYLEKQDISQLVPLTKNNYTIVFSINRNKLMSFWNNL